MMFWYGDGAGGWGYALMTISMVLFWGLIILGIVVLVRYLGRATQLGGTTSPDRSTPAQVLAERLARGEIDEDEYRRRLDALHANASRIPKL